MFKDNEDKNKIFNINELKDILYKELNCNKDNLQINFSFPKAQETQITFKGLISELKKVQNHFFLKKTYQTMEINFTKGKNSKENFLIVNKKA